MRDDERIRPRTDRVTIHRAGGFGEEVGACTCEMRTAGRMVVDIYDIQLVRIDWDLGFSPAHAFVTRELLTVTFPDGLSLPGRLRHDHSSDPAWRTLAFDVDPLELT